MSSKPLPLLTSSQSGSVSSHVVWHHATVTRTRREVQNGHRGAIIWLQAYQARVNPRWLMLSKNLYICAAAELLCSMATMYGTAFAAI